MTTLPPPSIGGSGPLSARIAIVTEAATADDIWKRAPLAGAMGDFYSKLLHEAGILRSECFIVPVIRTRQDSPGNLYTQTKSSAQKLGLTEVINETWCHPSLPPAFAQLQATLSSLPNLQVVIALGDLAMFALTHQYGSVDTWRGSILPAVPTLPSHLAVIPTYPPAAIIKQWPIRGFAIRDLQRVRDYALNPAFYTYPSYQFHIRPTYSRVISILHDLLDQLANGPVKLACDIETIARQISCIGIAWNVREALCIPFLTLDGEYWTLEEEQEICLLLRSVLTHENVEVIGQNFNYDNQYFARYHGYLPRQTFDTMIAQHVLFPGIPKALDFLSSMYCHYHRYWKDEINDYSRLPENMEQYWTYNCLSGDTPVLDAYCRWKPLASVQLGDDLLTFEEEASSKGSRKFIHAVVTNKASSYKEALRVTFTDGTFLDGTAEHKVVIQRPVPYRQRKFLSPVWEELGNLLPGDAFPHVPSWERSWEFEDGWIAGLADGEGTLGHHSSSDYKSMLISIAQKEGPVAARLRRGLTRHNFSWNEGEKHGVIYFGIRGGLSEQLRFLGIFETERLQVNMLQIAMEQGFGGSQQLPKKIVKSVTPIGKIEVFDITTTAGTFLTSSGIAHNCKDCCVTFEVALVLENLLDHVGRRPQYDFMQATARSALRSMLRGMRIDQKARSEVAGQLMQAIAEYETLIHTLVGFPLNVGSPKQMQDYFYGDLKLPVQIDRKTRRPTLNAKALATLAEKEPLLRPLIELIDKKRSIGVFLSTFCLMPLDSDGRMRCSFNVCGTETMRFSSSENAFGSGGNLQNIPKGEEK